MLAFALENKLEYNMPEIYAEPIEVVVDALTTYDSWLEVYNNLPDVKL
jgi:hypothetical protein